MLRIVSFRCSDGTYQAVDLMLDRGGVQDMVLGKVFTATAKVHHVYKARKRSDGKPFTAYFAGGTRGHALQSSAATRVRLETTVNIQAMKCVPMHEADVGVLVGFVLLAGGFWLDESFECVTAGCC